GMTERRELPKRKPSPKRTLPRNAHMTCGSVTPGCSGARSLLGRVLDGELDFFEICASASVNVIGFARAGQRLCAVSICPVSVVLSLALCLAGCAQPFRRKEGTKPSDSGGCQRTATSIHPSPTPGLGASTL